jgi:hypothetical protein
LESHWRYSMCYSAQIEADYLRNSWKLDTRFA